MSCKRESRTNGEPSKLFDSLFAITDNESDADSLFAYFNEPEFIKIFGDYKTQYNAGSPNITEDQKSLNERVDDNGEPILFYNKRLNKHFYIDKNEEPVFYPSTSQGLLKTFNTNDIKLFSETLALNFYQAHMNFDYNKLEFINQSTKTLKEFIEGFIDSKVSELMGSENINMFAKGVALEASKSEMDEWVSEVKDYFTSLNVNYTIQDDIDKEEQAESPSGELMRKESFLKSNKDNINNNVKLYLSLFKGNTLNHFGEYTFYSFDRMYAILNKTLSGEIAVEDENGHLEDIFTIYLDKIDKLSKVDPIFTEVKEKLLTIGKDSYFKYQIISAFNLFKKNFLTSEVGKDLESNPHHTVKNVSDVSSRKKAILTQWDFNNEQRQLRVEDLKKLLEDNNKLLSKLTSLTSSITNEEDLIPLLTEFKTTLNALGVEYTAEAFDLFLDNLELEERALSSRIKAFRSAITGLSHGLLSNIEGKDNALSNQGFISRLSEAEAFLSEEGSDASVFAGTGTKWVYSLPSYIELKVAKWKKNPNSLRKLYMASDYNQSSLWMKWLTADDIDSENREDISRERLSSIEVAVFNSIQQEGDASNAVDNTKLSYVDSLVDYANKVLAFKKGGKVYHKTALAAGKGTEYQIYFGEKAGIFNVEGNAVATAGFVKVDSAVTDIFFEYANGEYKRIDRAKKDIEKGKNLTSNYHTGAKNALQMQLFKSLSPDNVTNILLYDEAGNPNYADLHSAPDDIKNQVKAHINNILSENIKSTYKRLISENVFTYNEAGVLINNAMDQSIYDSYSGNKALKVAADMFVNSVISQVEYAKMFTGDPAFYKNPADYKKRVPSTYTDGLYMTLNNDEKYFNVAIIENVEIDAPSLEALKKYMPEKIWKQYADNNVNATDAQAWITPQRWKFIQVRIGKWSDEKEEVYKQMLNPNATYTKKQLKIVAQPLKGVYFDVNENGVPTFLKYSQAVLVPNLIKDTGLETLYNNMVKGNNQNYHKQIHEVIVKDGIKVGSPSSPDLTHDVNGNVLDSFELTPIKLNNSGWKLQQDLPIKGMKDTAIGSQIQKNMYQGLVYNLSSEFVLEDNSVKSGSEMIEYLNELVSTLSNKGMISLLGRLGVDKDTLKIRNEDALYSSMIAQLKTRRDVPANFIKALEAKISPYGIPGGFKIFQNVFSSMVNNETVKIKTNGGGLIQMSDYGLSKSEAANRGIVFTPWFNSANGKLAMPEEYVDIDGKTKYTASGIFLSGSMIAKYVPDYKSYRNNPEKLFGTLNEETGKYEGGIIDQKILTNIIGYRIPNQGLPSNDALQVMGILPEEMGDVIIPYTGITTKTGSDFDIDKMYLMIPSFESIFPDKDFQKARHYIRDNKITKSQIINELQDQSLIDGTAELDDIVYDIFIKKVLFTENDSGYYSDFNNEYDYKASAVKLKYSETLKDEKNVEYPMYQQPIEAIQNKLIEAYKSILLNKDVISDVFTSLDAHRIKDDVINLNQEMNSNDMLDFDAISDLEIKNQFTLGKAGLGQNVNSLVDSVRGAMANLSLNSVKLGWGFENKHGDTSFDAEFSEELSPKEIKDYVASYNNDNKGSEKVEPLDLKSAKEFKSIKLFESMMELINAFVDIEKDPYIVKANWVTQTNNVGFLLLRAGVHPFKVNAFLSQPILKEYVKYKNNQESRAIDNSNNILPRFLREKASELYSKQGDGISINNITFTRDKFIKAILTDSILARVKPIPQEGALPGEMDEYITSKRILKSNILSSVASKFKLPISNEVISEKALELYELYEEVFEAEPVDFKTITLKDLRDNVKKEQDIRLQLAVLEKFLKLQTHAKVLTKGVSASKPDVEGKGKNINSLIISKNKIENILNNQFDKGALFGFNDKLEYNGKPTMLKTYVDNSIYKVYDIMKANPKYFLGASNMAVSSFNEASNRLYGSSLENSELGDKLENGYYSYVLSGFKPLHVEKADRMEFLTSIPNRLLQIKKELPDNALLKELFLKNSDFKSLFFISMSNVKKSVRRKNSITDAWKDLLDSHPEFAEDLIKYSYLTSGFNNTLNQFHEFIPYEWFNKNRFNSYLKDLGVNKDHLDRQFIDQFFRHHKLDASIVKRAFNSDMVSLAPNDGFKTGYISDRVKSINPYLTKYELENDTYYYKLIGFNTEGRGVYIRTSMLGFSDKKGNKVFEYNLGANQDVATSIFKDNKLTSIDVNVELRNEWLNDVPLEEMYNADMIVQDSDANKAYPREHDDIFTKKPEENLDMSENSSIFTDTENDQLKFDFPC